MAKHVLTNAWVRVNNVDLSDHVESVEVSMTADDVQVTAMGQGGVDRLQGIRDDSFQITFWNDFAAGSVEPTLTPLMTGASIFLVEVSALGSTISTTNPKFSGSCILTQHTPISGAVGDGNQTSITFPVKGTITRGTS
jgi:hypothetical protein